MPEDQRSDCEKLALGEVQAGIADSSKRAKLDEALASLKPEDWDVSRRWLASEKWVWSEIQAGRIADFNELLEPLDPCKSDGWSDERVLSPAFLKEILFREPYRSNIPVEGVRIVGARFPEKLDLAHGHVERKLCLEKCRFVKTVNLAGLRVDDHSSLEGSAVIGEGTASLVDFNGAEIHGFLSLRGTTFLEVNLANAKVDGRLSLDCATVAGKLNMDSLHIGRDLLMFSTKEAPASFQEVILTGTKVDGHLVLDRARVAGPLNMIGLRIGQHLLMRGTTEIPASFQEVNLAGTKVDGALILVGATVAGKLNMDSLHVGQNLLMFSIKEAPASFQEVILANAKVDGQLSLNGARVAGPLNMISLKVGRDLSMSGTTEIPTSFQEVDLIFAQIGSNLDLSGAELKILDLSATRIEGELQLGSSQDTATHWRKGARFNLRNVHAATLQDWADRDPKTGGWLSSWPCTAGLQLDGFTYDRLGGFGTEAGNQMRERDVAWYLDWLARDEIYSPQPHEQLAATFRKAGEPTKADEVLYAGRERARAEAKKKPLLSLGDWSLPSPRWLGLSLLKWTIGYGIGLRYFLIPLGWVFGLATVSTIILLCTGQPITCEESGAPRGCLSNDLSDGFLSDMAVRWIYSLGQVLPVVELDPAHKNVQLEGWVWLYFVGLLRPFGYYLAAAVVAGMAGLTQSSRS